MIGAGAAFTVIVADAVLVHKPFETVTEYVLVVVGEIFIEEVVCPLLHE